MVLLGGALLTRGDAERAWAGRTPRPSGSRPTTPALGLRLRALSPQGRRRGRPAPRRALPRGRDGGADPGRPGLGRPGQAGRAESEFADATARHREDAAVWRAYADWYRRTGLPRPRRNHPAPRGVEAVPTSARSRADLAAIFEAGEHADQARRAMAEAAASPRTSRHPGPTGPAWSCWIREVDAAVGRWEALLVRHPARTGPAHRPARNLPRAAPLRQASAGCRTLLGWHPGDAALLGTLGQVLLRRRIGARRPSWPCARRSPTGATHQPLLATALASTSAHAEARHMFEVALVLIQPTARCASTFGRFLEATADPRARPQPTEAQLARDPQDAEARATAPWA
ncbi:MAG: hypothetical protein R3F43_21985 [bacterium]